LSYDKKKAFLIGFDIVNCVTLTEVRDEMVGLKVTIVMFHILKRKSGNI
jgi:hypothetical protein